MGNLSQKLVVPDDAGFESSRDVGFKQNRRNSAYADFEAACSSEIELIQNHSGLV